MEPTCHREIGIIKPEPPFQLVGLEMTGYSFCPVCTTDAVWYGDTGHVLPGMYSYYINSKLLAAGAESAHF